MTVDALGNPIVIGKTYGYSTSASIQRVVVGEVVAVNDYKAQIKPITVKQYLCGKEYVPTNYLHKKTPATPRVITVAGYLLFPVQPNDA